MKKSMFFVKISLPMLLMIFSIFTAGAQTEAEKNHPNLLMPEFKDGIIKLKTGKSYSVPLNFDKVNQNMVVRKDGQYWVLEEISGVDTIIVEGRRFIIDQGKYSEVIVNSPISLFVRHISKLESVGSTIGYGAKTTTASITHVNKLYGTEPVSLEVPDNFRVVDTPEYLVRVNGNWIRISNRKQFLKAFPGKEEQLKSFVTQNGTDFKKLEDLINLVYYSNTL